MNTQSAGNYYRHSGKFGLLGLAYMLVFGAVGALVLGLVYAYADDYIPLVYFNLLLVVAYGCGVGACVHFGAKLGKVRNVPLLLLGGFVAGLMAEYSNWVWWVYAYSKQEVLVYMPADLWQVIQEVNEQGAWSVFGSTPTGVELWAYWGLEALVIVAGSTAIAWLTLSSLPFCEACGRWADSKDTVSPLDAVAEPQKFKAKLELKDYEAVKSLHKMPAGAMAYTEVVLQKCPSCNDSNFMTVQAVTVTLDKKGKANRRTANVLQNLILGPDAYRSIKGALQGP